MLPERRDPINQTPVQIRPIALIGNGRLGGNRC
jgi:hypothetical protein